MRFFVKNGSTTSGFYRAWLGTRADYNTATANLPNGTLIGITDEAETSIDLTNVGSGVAFSILPTYRKVAIWYRTN